LLAELGTASSGIGPLRLLKAAGLDVVETRVARSVVEARAAADQLGYPVVVKAADPNLAHKTESGAVALRLRDGAEVERAARTVLERSLAGVLVQPQLSGLEIILGIHSIPALGAFALAGLGGILAEVMDDVVVRPLPLATGEAGEMLAELRGSSLLDGYRGGPACDRDALSSMLEQLAELGAELDGTLVSLDLNPVIATIDRAVAVDALIVRTEDP
jgi:hypothetical protein